MIKTTKTGPPRAAELFLKLFANRCSNRAITGDFEEEYFDALETRGQTYARLLYWKLVLISLPSFVLDNFYWSLSMFRNYFKIAFRNIKRHKLYSLINISGLAVGLACTILILLYIQYEFSYDKYHKNAKNIYRVLLNGRNGTPPLFASHLKDNFPEAVNSVTVKKEDSSVKYKNNIFRETRFYFTGNEFLEIFTYPLIKGDKEFVLKNPFSLVLTQEMAEKYFGEEDPVGKTVYCNTYGKKFQYTVTGVIKNVPENSHFKFDFLASMISLKTLRGEGYITSWNNFAFKTYFLLDPDAVPEHLENKVLEYYSKRMSGRNELTVHFQALTDIHLYGGRRSGIAAMEFEANSDIKYIYLYSSIAVIILLTACFNYINLSTARSHTRFKEVGLRKVAGAKRSQLMRQFFGESIIFVLSAFLISLFLVYLSLPAFRTVLNTNLELNPGSLQTVSGTFFIFGIFCILLFTGLAAGIYPAIVLSSFTPVKALKGNSDSGFNKTSIIRNTLVVFQFVVSSILVVCSILLFSQLNFIKNKDLGFKKDFVITTQVGDRNLKENTESLKNELLLHSDIINVSASSGLLTDIGWGDGPDYEGKSENTLFYKLSADFNFLDLYEMEVIEGRKFSKLYGSDKDKGILLNEAAVRELGWKNPLGKQFDNGVVTGILKDFHFESLHIPVKPFYMFINTDNKFIYYLSIRIKPGNIQKTISFLESKWKEFSPDYPFDYSFVDSDMENMYRNERNISKLFQYLTFIAVIITCLGLFGISSFIIERRAREFAVRKVLGASGLNITWILLIKFISRIFIAGIIAYPAAFFVMDKWLQNFAFKVKIGWEPFIISLLFSFLITFVSIGTHVIKAVRVNPVEFLRQE